VSRDDKAVKRCRKEYDVSAERGEQHEAARVSPCSRRRGDGHAACFARAVFAGRPLIGLLSPTSAATAARLYGPFRAVLHELGYVEGRNIWIESRYADGVPARLPALAAELVALKPDLIVATSTPGTVAASGATRTIPVLMITLQDPVALGVVKSIARPGGNVTGIWTFGGADALIGKRIGLLKEVVPALSRMGVMIASDDASGEIVLKLLPAAASALGVTYKVFPLRTNAELEDAFAQAVADGLQGLFIDQSPYFLTRRAEVAALAARAQLPAIYGYREHAEAGGLMSYGTSLTDGYRQIARLTDKVLKGAKPAELPVEQLHKFELVVNNKTAKTLGLKISESFLLRADEVIE
jgi:putative ABC transport system substrate-binding protein